MGQIEQAGGPGEQGTHVAFWRLFSSVIIAKVQKKKPTREIKTGPFIEGEAAFSQDGWRRICLEFSAIWLSELFPVVIKS